MTAPPKSVIASALPTTSRITARITILTFACRPPSPVFGSRRPAISTRENPARVANSAEARPLASQTNQVPTPSPDVGKGLNGPVCTANMPNTASARARSTPTSRAVDEGRSVAVADSGEGKGWAGAFLALSMSVTGTTSPRRGRSTIRRTSGGVPPVGPPTPSGRRGAVSAYMNDCGRRTSHRDAAGQQAHDHEIMYRLGYRAPPPPGGPPTAAGARLLDHGRRHPGQHKELGLPLSGIICDFFRWPSRATGVSRRASGPTPRLWPSSWPTLR